MKLILAWLESKIAILRWGVMILSLAAIAWATHHLDVQAQQASEASQAKAELKQTVESTGKVNEIRNKNAALPRGAAFNRLLAEYSRD
jgi:hypothetical protein